MFRNRSVNRPILPDSYRSNTPSSSRNRNSSTKQRKRGIIRKFLPPSKPPVKCRRRFSPPSSSVRRDSPASPRGLRRLPSKKKPPLTVALPLAGKIGGFLDSTHNSLSDEGTESAQSFLDEEGGILGSKIGTRRRNRGFLRKDLDEEEEVNEEARCLDQEDDWGGVFEEKEFDDDEVKDDDEEIGRKKYIFEDGDDEERLSCDSSIDSVELEDLLMGVTDVSDKFTRAAYGAKRRKKSKRSRHRATPFSATKKKTARKKTAAMPSNISPELQNLLINANDAYLNRDFEKAIELLEEVVREGPGIHDPFHTLGLIYEEEFDDKVRALDYYLLAAHLVPGDAALWKRIGKMSHELGNLDQAIYCLKRNLKNSAGKFDDEVIFELGVCFVKKKEYKNAAVYFNGLFKKHTEDTDVCAQLVQCYENMNNLNDLVDVLSKHYTATAAQGLSMNFMLLRKHCEVLVELKRFEDCKVFILDAMKEAKTRSSSWPLPLQIFYLISQMQLKSDQSNYSAEDILWERSEKSSTFTDLHLALANAYFETGNEEKAVKHFQYLELKSPSLFEANVEVCLRFARCYVKLKMLTNAEEILKKFIKEAELTRQYASQARNHTTSVDAAEFRILLSEVYTEMNRLEDADQVLMSVPPKNLRDSDTLPRAIPNNERLQQLLVLQTEFEELMELKLSDRLPETKAWCSGFINLINECELDTQRIIAEFNRMRSKLANATYSVCEESNALLEDSILDAKAEAASSEVAAPSRNQSLLNMVAPSLKKKDPSKVIQYNKVKLKMGLKSLEDMLGWGGYMRFLQGGIGFLRELKWYNRSIELLESIISNKKQDRTVDKERQIFKNKLEELSLKFSLEAGLSKIALGYIRARYLQNQSKSMRAVEVLGRFLFTGKLGHQCVRPIASVAEKEIFLENRSWLIRQLLAQPNNFYFTLIVGHFCTLSGRWPFAVAEYMRAHMLQPEDDLCCLCLATAYLNFATSRAVKDRQRIVMFGFSFLCLYKKQRLEKAKAESASELQYNLFVAEACYNLARGYHHLGLLYLCVPLYMRCLQGLDNLRNAMLENSAEEVNGGCYTHKFLGSNLLQIRMASAYNLFIIWKKQGDNVKANEISEKYLTWD